MTIASSFVGTYIATTPPSQASIYGDRNTIFQYPRESARKPFGRESFESVASDLIERTAHKGGEMKKLTNGQIADDLGISI
jgi:hypothetical protein